MTVCDNYKLPLCWLLCHHINTAHNQPTTHTCGEAAAESDKQ